MNQIEDQNNRQTMDANSAQLAMSNEDPSAPPMDQMQTINGYEWATFTPATLPPPTYAETMATNSATTHRLLPSLTNICEEEAKIALSEFVGDHCCYGSSPVKQMAIKDIIMKSAFHYKLETFAEKRETAWVCEPYKGQPLSACLGPAPRPWDVCVAADVPFQKCEKTVEIPQTAVIRVCHVCAGIGRIRCNSCAGFGGSTCFSCNGHGRRHNVSHNHHHNDGHHHNDHHHHQSERCFSCNGTGRSRCMRCHGNGQVRCHQCKGHCQLKCYLQLIVKWNNYFEDFVSDFDGHMPQHLVKQVSGKLAFEERFPRVQPLTNFTETSIVNASRVLIERHLQSFPMERIIEQRHSVHIVPIASVVYSHKAKEGIFNVYGLEHKVYFPDYPSKCFCTIL